MSRKRKQYKIYGPAHFAATWEKFGEICERDGTSRSEVIRLWVSGAVRRKDPGNPQRPITAWMPGHPDEEALREQELYQKLRLRADRQGGEIRYRVIFEEVAPHIKGRARIEAVKRIAGRLTEEGVKVWR